MIEATDETFAKDTAEGTVLVDFYADWCGPCKALAPALEKLESDLGIKVVKVNIDSSEKTPTEFAVRNIPTLHIMKDGKSVATKSGSQTYSALKAWVEANK